MKRCKNTIPAKQVGLWLIIVLLLLLTGVVVLLSWSGSRILGQYVKDIGNSTLQYFQKNLDYSMEEIAQFCAQNLSDTSAVQAYNSKCDEITALTLRKDIRSTLELLLQKNTCICYAQYIPNCSTPNPDVRLTTMNSLKEADLLEETIDNLRNKSVEQADVISDTEIPITNKRALGEWFWVKSNDQFYLSRIVELENGICIVCMDTSVMDSSDNQEAALTFLCEQNHFYIGSIPPDFDTESEKSVSLLFGKNKSVLFSTASHQGSFNICCVVSSNGTYMQKIFLRCYFIIVLLLLFFIFICILFVHRAISPFLILDSACKAFGNGELTARISGSSHFSEVMQIYGTFNWMVEQNQNLKICLYEHQLAEQRSKTAMVRTKIKSHFFTNCLNIIYSLACVGKNDVIKEFSLCLVDYFRFLGTSFQDTVYLSSELEHLRNYVRIFEFRYPGMIHCTWNIEPDTDQFRVVPMISQVFLENIFQHAMIPGKVLEIKVQVTHDIRNGISGMLMKIMDNGPGFSITELEKWKVPLNEEEMSEHGNGIRNAWERMCLFYHDKADLSICNRENGAYVQLFYPEINEGKEDDDGL